MQGRGFRFEVESCCFGFGFAWLWVEVYCCFGFGVFRFWLGYGI